MMDVLWLLARLILIIVLGIAGTAKLADRNGSRQALISFGVPRSLARPFGVVLPLLEITLALALIPAATAWWGAFGALGLMLLFIAGIGINLVQGRKPDCHCFGQLYSAPAGWPALLRNAFFAVIAGSIVWWGSSHVTPSFLGLRSFLSTAEILVVFSIFIVLTFFVFEGWLLFHLLKQNGRLLVRIEVLEKALAVEDSIHKPSSQPSPLGLPIGTAAPDFYLPDLNGKKFSLDDFQSDVGPRVLIFSNPDCAPCDALMPEIAQWQRDYADQIIIILILQGSVNINRAKVSQQKLTNVLLQNGYEVAESYGAIRTPSAVIVRPDGTIGSEQALGADQIRDLVAGLASLPNLTVQARVPVNFNASNNSPGLSMKTAP